MRIPKTNHIGNEAAWERICWVELTYWDNEHEQFNVLKCFNLIIDKIENVSLKIAEDSMNCAAEELNGVSSEDGNNSNV